MEILDSAACVLMAIILILFAIWGGSVLIEILTARARDDTRG